MVFGKWGGGKHWEYDAVRLGEDHHGTWVGAPTGTVLSRPGAEFTTDYDHIALVPAAGFIASFYGDAPTAPASIYVDICTLPVWDGPVLRAIDLDLDVIRDRADRVWVDDEDEFTEHQVKFGYPETVVAQARQTCDDVLHRVQTRAAPFDGATARGWLEVLAGL